MAKRPIYIPLEPPVLGVDERIIDFQWFPGMSLEQKRRSVDSLHAEANAFATGPILEISSKSKNPLGVNLSAFNLKITTQKHKATFTVENAFQSSKVFDLGGPFTDLLLKTSREAKKDRRLSEHGDIVGFCFFKTVFPAIPRTYFYDWLYVNALRQNMDLADEMMTFHAYSDIEFNPKKSINCQAYSAAIYHTLMKNNKLEAALESPQSFLDILSSEYARRDQSISIQKKLV